MLKKMFLRHVVLPNQPKLASLAQLQVPNLCARVQVSKRVVGHLGTNHVVQDMDVSFAL